MKTLVFARNKNLGDQAARDAGLADWEYVGSATKLRGRTTSNTDRLIDPSFEDHQRHDEIAGALAIADATAKPPVQAAPQQIEVLVVGYTREETIPYKEAKANNQGQPVHLIRTEPTVHNGMSATRYTFTTK